MPSDLHELPRAPLWKVGDVAAYCNVTENTVRLWAARNLLRGSKLGGEWRFRPEDVEDFIVSGTGAAR